MGELIALNKEILADLDTPVSAYMKLCTGQGDSFLFESGEGMDSVGRYSIVAWDPLHRLELNHGGALHTNGQGAIQKPATQFFDLAREVSEGITCPDLPPLPFVGSMMGYVGYDAVRLIERLPAPLPSDKPIARLSYSSRFVVFDHLLRKMNLVAIAEDRAGAGEKLADMEARLRAPLGNPIRPAKVEIAAPSQERFVEAVKKAKEYILDGDIFQVVLSDQFRGQTDLDPLSAYRWLRVTNPSPYMFFLNFGDLQLAGASPETLVKVENGEVNIRPIAGTRRRSADQAKDKALEEEMLASEKERAEHVMLVDLARNDAGRVSKYGSVEVSPYMIVERFSHVMHISSQVNGRLRPGLDAWDAFTASFPAGTVSGAPKVRAMEIIDELEDKPRGPYAGAVGRFGPGPDTDTCIAIRMIQFQGDEVTLQAGAGIVADSDPVMEYQEINHKAAQGMAALRAAAEEGK